MRTEGFLYHDRDRQPDVGGKVLIFETSKTLIDVADFKDRTIKMRESVNSLDAVKYSPPVQ
jgi:hypothetical protein